MLIKLFITRIKTLYSSANAIWFEMPIPEVDFGGVWILDSILHKLDSNLSSWTAIS